MFPDNLVQACFQQARTSFKAVEKVDNETGNVTIVYQQDGVEYANGMNVLGKLELLELTPPPHPPHLCSSANASDVTNMYFWTGYNLNWL